MWLRGCVVAEKNVYLSVLKFYFISNFNWYGKSHTLNYGMSDKYKIHNVISILLPNVHIVRFSYYKNYIVLHNYTNNGIISS